MMVDGLLLCTLSLVVTGFNNWIMAAARSPRECWAAGSVPRVPQFKCHYESRWETVDMKRTEKVSADSWRLGKLWDKKVKSRCVRVAFERAAALLHSAEPSSEEGGTRERGHSLWEQLLIILSLNTRAEKGVMMSTKSVYGTEFTAVDKRLRIRDERKKSIWRRCRIVSI